MVMECLLVQQGVTRGNCLTLTKQGEKKRACEVTLRVKDGQYERLIKSHHLSRPEDYFSIYQSGCNHDCIKCHSSEFSKRVNGRWINVEELAQLAKNYLSKVTVEEPRERATMWHAEDLCYHCGSCVLYGQPSDFCPKKLSPAEITFSPQGFGPARNIVAFTGGDLTCQPEYYAQAAQAIKEKTDGKLWILIETNGYALTRKNLELLKEGGIDSFWLDIKAFNPEVYKKLCGTSNKTVLKSLTEMVELNFTVEVLTLYIPGFVETDQHKKIAQLICETNDEIPTTLLAFFPSYKLSNLRSPNYDEMMRSYKEMKGQGVKNLRFGNIGIFAKTKEQLAEIQQLRK